LQRTARPEVARRNDEAICRVTPKKQFPKKNIIPILEAIFEPNLEKDYKFMLAKGFSKSKYFSHSLKMEEFSTKMPNLDSLTNSGQRYI